MTTSLLTVAPATGPGALPIHVAQDTAGNYAAGHSLMVETGGVATPAGVAGAPLIVSDPAGAAYQGVVAIVPGVPTAPLRSLGYQCTTAGSVTLTLADGSTITLSLPAGPFATLPFAVSTVVLGTGVGSFWNLK